MGLHIVFWSLNDRINNMQHLTHWSKSLVLSRRAYQVMPPLEEVLGLVPSATVHGVLSSSVHIHPLLLVDSRGHTHKRHGRGVPLLRLGQGNAGCVKYK